MSLEELYKQDRKEFFRLIGAKGGKAKVKKGFATMPLKRLRQIGSKGGKRRNA